MPPSAPYTLSLHDALPISRERYAVSLFHIHHAFADGFDDARRFGAGGERQRLFVEPTAVVCVDEDRKSTRLNSSHLVISYAVFCLKKKRKERRRIEETKAE